MSYNLSNIIKRILKEGFEDEKSMEELQADLRSNDKDMQTALAKWGLSGDLGYIPLSSMIKPFRCSVKIKHGGQKIPLSWQGETTQIEQGASVSSFDLLLWLDPQEQKRVVSGESLKTYTFKVIKRDGETYENDYIEFLGKEINVIDKRIGEKLVPQIRTDRKYRIMWHGPMVSENITKNIVNTLLEQDINDEVVMELIFDNIDIKGIKRGEELIDDNFNDTIRTIMGGKDVKVKVVNFTPDKNSIKKVSDSINSSTFSDPEKQSIYRLINSQGTFNGGLRYDNKSRDKISLFLGKTDSGKDVWFNIPFNSNNGKNVGDVMNNMKKNHGFTDCGFAVAKPHQPLIEDGLILTLKIDGGK